jgi:hypothetical protein
MLDCDHPITSMTARSFDHPACPGRRHDFSASLRLANLLAKYGHIDELRARADAGNHAAAGRLVSLLTEQGRVDELEAEVHAGTVDAADRFLEA